MATYSKRTSGRWQAKIRRGRTSLSKTFATKTDAMAWARKEESVVERGFWMDNAEAERTTLGQALHRYRDELVSKKKGAREESSMISVILDDPISSLTLARTRSADVSQLIGRWQKIGYKPATIVRRIAVIRHLFETARKTWGMEGLQNPTSTVSLPRVQNSRNRRVKEQEIQAIFQATNSASLPGIVQLAIETAMRRGEIASIRWKDIDLKRRVIHLEQTKNGHHRDVPLSTRAAELLAKLSEKRPQDQTRLVFESRSDTITQAFDRSVKRARRRYEQSLEALELADPKYLTDLRFHDLRHEATSRMAGLLSVHELAKVTGHGDLRMLMRYYHPKPEDLADKLG